MSINATPLRLSTLIFLHICISTALAEQGDDACDGRAMSALLRADQVRELDAFRAHCGDKAADSRGFTLYDRARLAGRSNLVQALEEQAHFSEGDYSPAMGKLIQTGLRFLNFDAGIIDGHLGERSLAAIARYQKKYGFSEDGKLHSDWLADFYRRLTQKTQQALTDLGFNAGGADGIIGPNTITALQAFRQERQLPTADYREIDDQLLYQLMMMAHEKNKKELAKRDAERAARRVAQEAARRKEIARARAEAKRRAEAERRAAEAAAIAAQQQREAEERRVEMLNITAAKQAEERRVAAAQQAQAIAVEEKRASAQEAAQAARAETEAQQAAARAQAQAAREQALADARAKAEAERARAEAEKARLAQQQAAAERAAAAQKAREAQARQAALQAKAAEERAAREAAASAKAAEQARKEAQKALQNAKKNKPVVLSQDMARATAVQGSVPMGKGFSELKGVLQFSGATSCTVAGQPIESSWCESYYPSGNGKTCTVVMSKSGLVVSFLCN